MGKTQGSWAINADDFIVNHSGERSAVVAIAYSGNIDNRGYVCGDIWYDTDQNGLNDKDEKRISKFKADAQVVYTEFDSLSLETGRITLCDESGTFSLFYEGNAFAQGQIYDMDFFLG